MIRLVIVDDHPIFRAGLRAAIDGQPDLGVLADLATAEEALALLGHETADVVLMDLHMPGMGGAAGTAAIARMADPPRVVVLTTFSSDADITAALDAGARGYLLKDAHPNDVFDAIRRVAAGGAVITPLVADQMLRRRTNPNEQVSARELDVLELLAHGLGNRAIARRLHLSEATVKTHLAHIYKKLGVDNRTAAVVTARRRGIVGESDPSSD